MHRRRFLQATSCLALLTAVPVQARSDTPLLDLARALAQQPYTAPDTELPPPFADLTYDAFRAIRPKPGRGALLPHGNRFAVDLLPPGLYFPEPVSIEKQTEEGVAAIPFSTDLFDFDPRYFDEVPDAAPGAGFSGLRLRYPLNADDRLDEVLVIQGASYFRAIGQAMVYGLSARAVAVGTGGTRPEEFPRFTRLRLHPAESGSVRIEGMIDSPSLAGHVNMVLRPGTDTVMDLSVTILPRREIADIGVAPLTSMYLKGPIRSAVSDDFRPRVHDSDLLMIENGTGEQLWRPISNPATLQSSAFVDDGPQRFGLYQMPRDFADFEDTEARYHDRPNAVVTPSGDWGPGAVTLVEIPTGDEFMDNIVAFWRPQAPLQAGSEHRFDYKLTWTLDPPGAESHAILQSRSGREHDTPGARRYVVDFRGDATGLMADISGFQDVQITGESLFALPDRNATRITFLLFPGDISEADLRLVLRDADGHAKSPVWLHRWTRARDGGV
jgi:glucans biosynthesis protein